MTTATRILFIALSTIAVSYGWGMRGSAIGGEKGAMLPGAYLGLLLAFFSGNEIIQENFYFFSAIGAVSMYFGGTESYAQTMDYVLQAESKKSYMKGLTGLSIKGAVWFGIFAAFLSIGFSSLAGKLYSLKDIIIMFVLLPFVRIAGQYIFNYPQKPKENKFPKLYFSKGRHEEWGALVMVLVELVVFMIAKKDLFAIYMTVFGMIGGIVGWIIGIILMDRTSKKMKNGKFFFGKFQTRGQIDNWKIMEFALGAVGGFAVSLGLVLNFDLFQKTISPVSIYGINTLISKNQHLIAVIFLVLIAIDTIKHDVQENSKFALAAEKWERPLYAYAVLFLCLCGNSKIAQIGSFLLLLWVIIEKIIFEEFRGTKFGNIGRPIGYLLCAACGVYIMTGNVFSMLATWIMYSTVYVIIDAFWYFRWSGIIKPALNKSKNFGTLIINIGAETTNFIFFAFLCIILIAIGVIIF